MGVYTHLLLHQADGKEKRLMNKGGGLAILWLACFRPSDVIQEGNDGFGIASKIRCSIQTARRQFEEGLALLRASFPATNFDIGEDGHPTPDGCPVPGLFAFRGLLASADVLEAELDFYEPGIYDGEYPAYLLQALHGFWQPDIKIFYPSPDRGEAFRKFHPGVMTWAGAIRAMTIGTHPAEFHPPGKPIEPSTSLFSEEEYLRNYRFLAGAY